MTSAIARSLGPAGARAAPFHFRGPAIKRAANSDREYDRAGDRDRDSKHRYDGTARSIWGAWTSEHPLAGDPPGARPADVEEGYAVQRELDELAGAPAGWKIAATSKAGQAHIGADGPLIGRLYEFQRRRSGSTLSAHAMRMRSVEPEFAFIFAREPRGRGRGELKSDDVLGAVGVARARDRGPRLAIRRLRQRRHRFAGG